VSRDAGFAIADLDTGLLADPKVVALARRQRDPLRTSAFVGLYVAVVLESWSSARRVTLEEAAPAWWLDGLSDAQQALLAAGLLDDDGRIPTHVWDGWYVPAAERRDQSRDRWRRASAAARDRAKSVSDDSARSHASRTVPSVPTDSVRPSEATTRTVQGTDDLTTCPRCGDGVRDGDPGVVIVDRRGSLGHRTCPTLEAAVQTEIIELHRMTAP